MTLQVQLYNTIFSDDDFEPVTKPPEEIKDIPYDSLAAIVQLSKQQWGTEIYTTVWSNAYPENFEISAESQERADVVRRHFKNNFLLRRLKNQHISEWMKLVDEALEFPRLIKKEWLAPLINLPLFYDESVATAEIFKNVRAIDPTGGVSNYFNGEIKFVGKVQRIAKRESVWRYYFKDQHNHLMLLNLESHSPAIPVWNYMIENSRNIEIEATVALNKHPAHDAVHFRLTPDYKIVKVNS